MADSNEDSGNECEANDDPVRMTAKAWSRHADDLRWQRDAALSRVAELEADSKTLRGIAADAVTRRIMDVGRLAQRVKDLEVWLAVSRADHVALGTRTRELTTALADVCEAFRDMPHADGGPMARALALLTPKDQTNET